MVNICAPAVFIGVITWMLQLNTRHLYATIDLSEQARAEVERGHEQLAAVNRKLEDANNMMQLANVFRGNMDNREGWGWHDPQSWQLYFDTLLEIGQISIVLAAWWILRWWFKKPWYRKRIAMPASSASSAITICLTRLSS